MKICFRCGHAHMDHVPGFGCRIRPCFYTNIYDATKQHTSCAEFVWDYSGKITEREEHLFLAGYMAAYANVEEYDAEVKDAKIALALAIQNGTLDNPVEDYDYLRVYRGRIHSI